MHSLINFVTDRVQNLFVSTPDNPAVGVLAKATTKLPHELLVQVCRAVRNRDSMPAMLQHGNVTAFLDAKEKTTRVFFSLNERLNHTSSQKVTFSKALMCRFTLDGRLIEEKYTVRKIIQLTLLKSEKESAARIDIMQRLANKKFFPKNHAFKSSEDKHIVFQEKAGCDLFDLYEARNGLCTYSKSETLNFALQLVGAACELVEKGVIHRDLKIENILVCDSTLKVTDFGYAQLISESTPQKDVAGTITMLAPELIHYLHRKGALPTIGHEVDIWSLGIVLNPFCTNTIFDHVLLLDQYDDAYKTLRLALYVKKLMQDPQTPETQKKILFYMQKLNIETTELEKKIAALERTKIELYDAWSTCINALPGPPDAINCLQDVVQAMLQKDPQQRITAHKAREALQVLLLETKK